MRLLKKFTVVVLALIALAVMPTRADASLLTINDGANATWSLSTQDNCTTCTSILSVVVHGGSTYITNFLADFQWTIDGTTPVTSTLTATNATPIGDWAISEANLNAGGCTGGDPHAVCGDWTPAGGFGPLAATTYFWDFTTTFSSPIGTPTSGNIRALVIDSHGNIVSLFSPGGSTFFNCTVNCQVNPPVPEPASMLLFGLGALATAYRVRRRVAR